VRKIKLARSILSADFSRLGEQVREVTAAGADYIHIDVMDGRFVPNITIGPLVVDAVRKNTHLPLDVHLMIEEPDRYLADFASAGANILTVHIEAARHIHRTLQTIKGLGLRAGVSLNPATPEIMLREILPFTDIVLVMTVNPGFGGQKFIPEMKDKISALKADIQAKRLQTEVEVDGGINLDNAKQVIKSGADVLVAGASIFNAKSTPAQAVKGLRIAAESGL